MDFITKLKVFTDDYFENIDGQNFIDLKIKKEEKIKNELDRVNDIRREAEN